jgi:RNA polymerase sigma factor (sigma-70 family)
MDIFKKTISGKCHVYTHAELTLLKERAQQGDQTARENLIFSVIPLNINIANTFAKKFRDNGQIDIETLTEVGLVGIIEAVDSYDPAQGMLSTWATIYIRKHILHYLDTNLSIIHIPKVAAWLASKHTKENPYKHIKEVKNAKKSHSLINRQNEITYNDDILHKIVQNEEHILLHKFIDQLPQRTQDIVKSRLNGETLESIGNKLGCTKENVRQLYEKAIDRLTHKMLMATE